MKLYRAKSLDDIAKIFRDNALNHTDSMNRATAKDIRNHHAGMVIAWNTAAYMLENMEIVPGPGILDEVLGPTENVGSTTK